MPIVSCPDCNKRLKLQSTPRSGQRVKCPGCESVFTPEVEEEKPAAAIVEKAEPRSRPRTKSDIVDEDEVERPRRRSRRDDDDDEDDERPRSRHDDDDEEDEDEDERPTKKRKKRRKQSDFPWVLVLSIVGGLAVVAIAVVLIFFNPFGSGGSSAYKKHDQVARDLLAQMTELMDAMDSVKDRNSARAAAQRINNVCDRLEKIAGEIGSLPKITTKEEKKLRDTYEPQFNKINSRAFSAGQRAGLSSGGEPSFIQAAQRLVTVGQRMQAAQPGWAR